MINFSIRTMLLAQDLGARIIKRIRDPNSRIGSIADLFFLARLFWIPITLSVLMLWVLWVATQAAELFVIHIESPAERKKLYVALGLLLVYSIVSYSYCVEEISIYERSNPQSRRIPGILRDTFVMRWIPTFIAAAPIAIVYLWLIYSYSMHRDMIKSDLRGFWLALTVVLLVACIGAALVFWAERKIAAFRRLGLHPIGRARRFVTLCVIPFWAAILALSILILLASDSERLTRDYGPLYVVLACLFVLLVLSHFFPRSPI